MAFRRSLALAVALSFFSFPITVAQASVRTLYVTVPGPLDACSSISPQSTDFSIGLGDLLYPSAFTNGTQDQLKGTGLAIASAELNSLSPEVVNYTVAQNLRWSNGKAFTAQDLVNWWHRARVIPSVFTDGYRSISAMSVSPDGLSVQATFSRVFANWPSLFRDVLYSNSPSDCRLKNLLLRPTLGFYSVQSASAHQIVLVKSLLLHRGGLRYGRVIISDSLPRQNGWARNFIGSVANVTSQSISSISGIASLKTTIASGPLLTQMVFSTHRKNVASALFREALGISVNRQILANTLYGGATLSVRPAPFVSLPTFQGVALAAQYGAPSDCLSCALDALKASGFHQSSSGWVNGHGVSASVRISVGPSVADHAAARFIVNTWKVIGIPSFVVYVSSELKAAASIAFNTSDVAIFTRSLSFGPQIPAREFYGSSEINSFAIGETSQSIQAMGVSADSNLNASSAATEWAALDSAVTHAYLARPLFFAPVIQAWSQRYTSVSEVSSTISLMDQIPTLRP